MTQSQFDSSLVWFTDNPQIFNKIYPKVVSRLQADMDHEEMLRDERMKKHRTKRKEREEAKEQNPEDAKPQRTVEEMVNEYVRGIENPWKEWKNEEFCEKDIIIFGQLEKK